MAFNYQALWGVVIAGGIVGTAVKYFKNRGEKEVQILNVIKRKEQETKDSTSGGRSSGRESNPGRIDYRGFRSREQSIEITEPIKRRRRISSVTNRTDDRVQQTSTHASKTTQQHRSSPTRSSRQRRSGRTRVQRIE